MDPRQLETLFQFSQFLEIVSNPQEMKQFLKDSKEVLDKQQLTLGLLTTKEKADTFLANAKQAWEAAQKKIQEDEQAHQEVMKKEKQEIGLAKAQTLQTLNAAGIRENASFAREKEAEEINKQVEKLRYEHSLILNQNKLKEEALAMKEAELNEKAAKLKQLLG